MSRSAARRKVTSSPSSRIFPSVGSSRPAIKRSVVVLPHPDGPNMTKNAPSSIVKVEPSTAMKSWKALRRFSTRIWAMACVSTREMTDDDEAEGSGQDGDEGIAVKIDREGLHQHDDAEANKHRRAVLPRAAPKPARQAMPFGRELRAHLRTAPKVMPRSRCLRSTIVKITIGIRNSVVAAATAGQSWPPSPMMKGMKGGMVCASPLVSSKAKAYSFHEKMR